MAGWGVRLVIVGLWIAAPQARAQAPVQCAGPLSEAAVIKLASSGVADARLIQIVNSCGAGFVVTRESEERLRAAGTSAAVIAALREKSPKPKPKPAPAETPKPREAPARAPEPLAAEPTDPKSQYTRGLARENGADVPVDFKEAVRLYRQAADQGYAPAQARLAYAYEYGNGMDVDYAQAMQLYRKAAEQGDAAGQAGVGHLYALGLGVPRDDEEAMRWARRGAAGGDARALEVVGAAYLNGRGVTRDPAEAVQWLRKSADAGDPFACLYLGGMMASGSGGPPAPDIIIPPRYRHANASPASADLRSHCMASALSRVTPWPLR